MNRPFKITIIPYIIINYFNYKLLNIHFIFQG